MNIKTKFGKELETELEKIGFDLRGHYPLIKTGNYTLDVDFEQSKVTIYYGHKQEKLATCKLSVADVVRKLVELNENITEHRFNDQMFMRILHDTAKGDERVAIPDIVSYFADQDLYGTKTKRTIRTLLSYDLSRLSTRTFDHSEISLVTATRAHTQRKSDFLWIPPEMYISHIKFRNVHPTSSDIRRGIDATVKGRSM